VRQTPANPLDRTSAEATGFATSHPVRAEILSALNEAERSQSELIRLLHLPQSTVQHHLKQLQKAGAIEVARTVWARGHERHIYRAIRIEDYLADEMASWSFEERQAFWSRTIQNSAAEAISGLEGGSIAGEILSWLGWARFNFDPEGWSDAYTAFEDFWNRIREIEIEADARHKAGGAELRTFVCSLQGYPRGRPGRSSYPKPGA
jgi:DNA-binding transcriptional ArsR family regulator